MEVSIYTNATVQRPSLLNHNSVNIEAVAELVPVALLVTIANGLVLVLFKKNTKLRTASNYVLFSLAVCDFMTGIINIPLFIIESLTPVIKSFEVRYYMAILQFPIRENRRETPSLLWRPTIYDRLRQAALDKKCLVLVVTMATIFLLCWLPWYIVMLLYRIVNDVKELEIPAHVFVLVRYATSVTNPVLYTLFRRDFQTALKFLFKIKRFKRRSRASDAETLQIKHRH
nr:muscarinic acetylcholine receptor gar-3-like [Pocillopora verrucosa]